MKRLNKGLLVTSGICGGLGLALLICGMLLGVFGMVNGYILSVVPKK